MIKVFILTMSLFFGANEWQLGQPSQTDNTNIEWVLGQPHVIYDNTAAAPSAAQFIFINTN